MVWVDPKYDLVYVFLSNRVYPTQENKKLIRTGVRTNIMDVIYESFLLP
jgi:beta-N-acetylhexosaminidase